MFSIVIPLYNKEFSITNTVSSVLNQSYREFEIIIVDDGSTDGSLEKVRTIDDERIRVIQKENAGVSSARNRGIREAKYEWIAFLDGDDLWKPDHLKVIDNLITEYPADKVFSSSFVRSNHPFPRNRDNGVEVVNDYFEKAIVTHFYWTSVAVVKKDVFETVGNFRTDIGRGEDLDLWARIGREYRFICSRAITAIYVQDAENKVTNSAFDYHKSVFVDMHQRIKRFSRPTEKKYFLKILWNGSKSFFRRGDWRNGVRTLYRLVVLNFVRIDNEKMA